MSGTGQGWIGEHLYVPRHAPLRRLNHWLVAVLFLLLAASGLSFFHPGFFFLSALFGGGVPARAVHPWLGVALLPSFLLFAAPGLRANIPDRDDLRWMLRFGRVAMNRHDGLPDLGKYNAGQKGVYWSQLALIPCLFATGLVIWEEYFGHLTTIAMQRQAVLAHSLAAVLAITVLVVHVYAAIWIKGTGRGMVRGTVTGGWAWLHHRRWLRESIARAPDAPAPGAGQG